MTLNLFQIIIRLLVATLVAGIIGWDREQRNHPAGIRTHILVCLGACILSLCQIGVCLQTLEIARENPALIRTITANPARITAQIVSGIGFLGAGTIVVTRHYVTGLTTAASLWVTAGLGIAIGMGYWQVSLVGSILVILVLTILNKMMQRKRIRQIEVKYYHLDTGNFLDKYFVNNQVAVKDYRFKLNKSDSKAEEGRVYTGIYTLKLPRDKSYKKLLKEILTNHNIVQVNSLEV